MNGFFQIIEIYPDIYTMLEILIIGFAIALIGAGGYVFFIHSMRKDRSEVIRKRMVSSSETGYNPWVKLSVQDENESPKNQTVGKMKIVLLCLATILFLLIVAAVIIKFGPA
jgi:hypothetical protein